MEEPVRLACPQCELVYRLKRYTPGKAYTCKNCGGPLAQAETLAAGSDAADQPPARPHVQPLFDNSGDLAGGRSGIGSGFAPESDLTRLPRLIEELSKRLDVLKDLEPADGESGPATKILELNQRLEADLHELKEAVEGKLAEFTDKVAEDIHANREELDGFRTGLTELDSRVASSIDEKFREIRLELGDRLSDLNNSVHGIADKASSSDGIDELKRELQEQQRVVLNRLEEQQAEQRRQLEANRDEQKRALEDHRNAQRNDLEALRKATYGELSTHQDWQRQAIQSLLDAPPPAPAAGVATTVEVDIDELADRLVAGLRGNHSKFMDPESGLAMDAMARLADELVKEQRANTTKLNSLADEIKTAAVSISKLEEWKGDLPERVADEIGQTVEARVVGPISGALAKQAPSILSDLQDNKLVDIVSRSVREAQRPLLREILSGSRGGVPVWLFASILLPLLLILGYLFLPGEIGGYRESQAALDEVSDSLARIESGMGSAADNEDRLRTIEEAVLDIHAEALSHAKNATTLEAENRNLKSLLAERDKLMEEYKETLQTQVMRLREYEMRLVQMGVSPKTMGE